MRLPENEVTLLLPKTRGGSFYPTASVIIKCRPNANKANK